MKTILFPLLVLISSTSALAVDFSGHWTGTGQWTRKDPVTGAKTEPCSRVEITIEHLPAQLTINRYHAVCGALDSDWGPHPLEIRGTQIFEDGEETGTIDGDTLKTLQPRGGVQYAFNLRLKTPAPGQPEILESYYGVRNLAGAVVIEGNLSKVPSGQ